MKTFHRTEPIKFNVSLAHSRRCLRSREQAEPAKRSRIIRLQSDGAQRCTPELERSK